VFIVGHLRGTCGRKVFPITQDGRETDGIPKQTVNTITTRTGQDNTVGTYVVENKQYDQIKQIVGGSQGRRVYDPTGVSITPSSQGGGIGNTTGLYAVSVLTPDRINKRQNGRRFKESGEPMFTLTGQDRHGVMIKDYKIRKLTPKECFRLQGFPDEYFERAASVNSDSQLYKQAGNSVTVNVIYEIARKL
jgi:DNA (cytosine-5)-methyltransferase 1